MAAIIRYWDYKSGKARYKKSVFVNDFFGWVDDGFFRNFRQAYGHFRDFTSQETVRVINYKTRLDQKSRVLKIKRGNNA